MRDALHPTRPALLLFDVNQTLLDMAPLQAMLVAAHGWDVAGAAWAGLQCAFVGRDGERPFPLAPAPTLSVAHLGALADRLGA